MHDLQEKLFPVGTHFKIQALYCLIVSSFPSPAPQPNLISRDKYEDVCAECPDGAKCDGTTLPVPIAGWWVDRSASEEVAFTPMACKRPYACKGAVDAESKMPLRPECWVFANFSSPACKEDEFGNKDEFGSTLMCADGAWGPGKSL